MQRPYHTPSTAARAPELQPAAACTYVPPLPPGMQACATSSTCTSGLPHGPCMHEQAKALAQGVRDGRNTALTLGHDSCHDGPGRGRESACLGHMPCAWLYRTLTSSCPNRPGHSAYTSWRSWSPAHSCMHACIACMCRIRIRTRIHMAPRTASPLHIDGVHHGHAPRPCTTAMHGGRITVLSGTLPTAHPHRGELDDELQVTHAEAAARSAGQASQAGAILQVHQPSHVAMWWSRTMQCS